MTLKRRDEDLKRIVADSATTISSLEGLLGTLGDAVDLVSESLRAGRCLLAFGNGGSAAQAQHIVAELVGRFQKERRALAAIALTTDTSVLTCLGNDYGFEEVFARQIRALGRPGDVALAISTSGNSPNVLKALDAARERGVSTLGWTGREGGAMRARVDLCLCVPADSTPRIQEAHLVLAHLFCQLLESSILEGEVTG